MATDDATVAALFRAALRLGIATPADLVPWADEQVMARDQPPGWILDLSLGAAEPADRVVAALEEVLFPTAGPPVFRLLLGLVDQPNGLTDPASRRAASWLSMLSSWYPPDDDDAPCDGAWAVGIEYGREELGRPLSDPDRVAAEVSAFIRDHADPAARAWLPGVRVTFGGDRAAR
jgi:hypothetical protein